MATELTPPPASPAPSPQAVSPRTLSAGGLLLRPLEEGDEPAVAEAMRDAGILRWAAGRAVTEAPEADRARRWLEPRMAGWSAGNAWFAVTEGAPGAPGSPGEAGAPGEPGEPGALLGAVSVREVHRLPDQAVVTYWVTPTARDRGIAARALDAAARWALGAVADGGLGLHRITLDHALLNTASCAVAERAGFRVEGTMRDYYVDTSGLRHDSHLHARLATDPVTPGA